MTSIHTDTSTICGILVYRANSIDVCGAFCKLFDISVLQVFLVDPGCFREIDELVRTESKGRALLEVMSLKEVNDEEERLE